MKEIFSRMFYSDRIIWIIFIVLSCVSVLAVFSASSSIVYKHGNQFAPIFKHVSFLILGFVGVVFLQRVPTKRFIKWFPFLLLFSIGLLVATLLFGKAENNAQRWLTVAGVSIQSSEFAKLALIGTVAFLLSKMKPENVKVVFWLIVALMGITCSLIVFDNLSTAVILVFICLIMMVIGQVPFKYMLQLVLAGVLLGLVCLLLVSVLPADKLPSRFATWKARVERFSDKKVDEETLKYVEVNGVKHYYDVDGENAQETYGKIAVANGIKGIGLPGSGWARDFLPQPYSDFIFAIIIEEMGMLMGLFVLSLYFFLMMRGGFLAARSPKLFPKFLILGLTLMLVCQALVNMAVAVGVIPVTGQPLPLISRGGTSTILTCVYFGVILACANIRDEEEKPDTTVDEDIANVEY